IALVGCGEIARKQHARFLLSGDNDTGLRLLATADPRGGMPSVERHYPDLRALLDAEPGVAAVSVASPTATHFPVAKDALLAGKHVLLEKPPTTTLGELLELQRLAAERGAVLVTAFHARHNAAVDRMRRILAGRRPPEHVAIEWREDFERWHAGQTWPWRPGGFGVFDPGINALSILCHVLPDLEFRVERARFRVPTGAATPALVEMRLAWGDGGIGDVAFEWRKGGGEDVWDISARGADEAGRTETLVLRGARTLLRNGAVVCAPGEDEEYAGVYRDFARAIEGGQSEVSLREMRIVEDAAAIAEVERSETAF
ncbi:MAG: Gfo/Idh/MocA family oxidoreductase, partial [Acetobacteraceae bacterium]|nr:Gfo/Idh/MocA family oxidoreductase [Acetobacteraceae bacterium]